MVLYSEGLSMSEALYPYTVYHCVVSPAYFIAFNIKIIEWYIIVINISYKNMHTIKFGMYTP